MDDKVTIEVKFNGSEPDLVMELSAKERSKLNLLISDGKGYNEAYKLIKSERDEKRKDL